MPGALLQKITNATQTDSNSSAQNCFDNKDNNQLTLELFNNQLKVANLRQIWSS